MIKDSGARQEFETGAVRDISKGKGRCDLLPLDVIGSIMGDSILVNIEKYKKTSDDVFLNAALISFANQNYDTFEDAMLDLSIHFEEGAEKYGIDNWKGLPEWSFLSSAPRHYLKFRKGMTDEPHGRAFMWNIVCLMAVRGYNIAYDNALAAVEDLLNDQPSNRIDTGCGDAQEVSGQFDS